MHDLKNSASLQTSEKIQRTTTLRQQVGTAQQLFEKLHVTPAVVQRWSQTLPLDTEDNGETEPLTPDRSYLYPHEVSQLFEDLRQPPYRYSLTGATWTRQRIRIHIYRRWGIMISAGELSDLLGQFNWKVSSEKQIFSNNILYLRVRGLYLLGNRAEQIAYHLQLSPQLVERWINDTAPRPWRAHVNARLTLAQLRQLPLLLVNDPPAYGLLNPCWTRYHVAQLIAQVYGVTYNPYHIPMVLRQVKRALQTPIEESKKG